MMVQDRRLLLLMQGYCLMAVIGLYSVAMTEATITMDPFDKYNLSWSVVNDSVTFTVQVDTTGWVGLGFSPNGGMSNADIIVAWVNSSGTPHLYDYYAVTNGAPAMDDAQNVTLISGVEEDGITSVTFLRHLNTCDGNDNAITSSTTRLIWAYGDQDPTQSSLASGNYHGTTNRGSKSVYLLEPVTTPIEIPDDASTHDFVTTVEIPAASTTYYCSFYKLPELTQTNHIIKHEPIITAGNEALVHHILVYACNLGLQGGHLVGVNRTQGVCENPEMPDDYRSCRAVAFGWAVGGSAVYYPENTGFPIGGESDSTYYMMEIHYDNPSLLSGRVDSSGIRVTYTPTLRQTDMAVLQVGSVYGLATPPLSPSFNVHGACFGDCTEKWIPEEGVKVFGYFLHSHLLGTAIKVRWYRNGKEMPMFAFDDAYDFNYQEYRQLSEEITLLPGDSFKITCTMKSTNRTTVTYGGDSTQEEMCLAFFSYYPRQQIAGCISIPGYVFDSNSNLYTNLGISARITRDGEDFSHFLDAITWNSGKLAAAQAAIDETPHQQFCLKTSTELYDLGESPLPLPTGTSVSLPTVDNGCPSSSEDDGSTTTTASSAVVLCNSFLIIMMTQLITY